MEDSLLDVINEMENKNTDQIDLLKRYAHEAKYKSLAYKYSEMYHRNTYKCLAYSLVLFSAANTILSGLKMDNYATTIVSACTLLFIGFDRVIRPKDKEHNANRISVEMGEIEANITHFLYMDNKKDEDMKSFAKTVRELLNTWNGLAPPIKERYVKFAQRECTNRPTLTNYVSLRKLNDELL